MNEDIKMKNEEQATEISVIDERTIRDKIYVVRGVQVMLDFELAEIYGYTTSAFNQQVKRNEEKFDSDFRFQLTAEETAELSISQNVTSIQTKGVKGGRSKLPWAFTESGIYMLMTVLKGNLATQQSKALIRTFRSMKEFIIENQGMIGRQEYLRLSMQVTDSIREGMQMRHDLDELSDEMKGVLDKLSDVVSKSEIAPILLELGKPEEKREYLFLNGQPMKADAAYISIYSQAKKAIHYVDDYLGAKTLLLLQDVRPGVAVTMFSDNCYNKLSLSMFQDFQTQFPAIPVNFITTQNKAHDRFIILDYDTADERIFHCGPSSKDAGKKLAAITEFSDGAVKKSLHDVVTGMLGNPALVLT